MSEKPLRRRLSLLSMSAAQRISYALILIVLLWLLVIWAQGSGA